MLNRASLVFASVLVLAAGILALALMDEPPGLHGKAHAEISGMRQGGDGHARHAELLLPGWLLGCCVILCFSTVVHFGALRGAGRKRLSYLLKGATLVYLACWSWLVWAYRASLDDTAPELILTLPLPTALMIFVFWPASMLFSALFVLGFDRWVLTPEEEESFRRLVEKRRAADGGNRSPGTGGGAG